VKDDAKINVGVGGQCGNKLILLFVRCNSIFAKKERKDRREL